jgi:hypothetical protein
VTTVIIDEKDMDDVVRNKSLFDKTYDDVDADIL